MDFISGCSEAAGNQIRIITHAADLRRILTRDQMPDLWCHLQSVGRRDDKVAAYA